MVRPISFKGVQKGFQGVSLRGFRGVQFFLWELCVCIKYLSLGDLASPSGYTLHPAEGFFSQRDCVMPVGERDVTICMRGGRLTTKSK